MVPTKPILATALLTCALATFAYEPAFERWQAEEDSMRHIPLKFREMWLRERGLEPAGHPPGSAADSGLALVGSWSRGGAAEVTGEDTLVVLSLGSEVALLSVARPDEPRVLSEVQLGSGVGQAQLVGSRLYVDCRLTFEVWDVANPASPARLGGLPHGIGGFHVADSLLFFLRLDTFQVYSVARPGDMHRLGVCRDSGSFLAATASVAVLGSEQHGLSVLDVSDPANPHRAGHLSVDFPISAAARGNLCCATLMSGVEPYPTRLVTLDISDPADPRLLGTLHNAGGRDLFLDGPLLFATGKVPTAESFQIMSIVDSTRPAMVGQCGLTDYYSWGVWAELASARAYVANECDGLAVLNIQNLNSPVRDTSLLGADAAVDLELVDTLLYVADRVGGLKVLNVRDPGNPVQIGEHDTLGMVETCYSVAAGDSFAYVGWFNFPPFRSLDISDPTRPRLAGMCDAFEYSQDMVLRDTLVYCTDHYRFEVINVSRPREPEVVGTCNISEWNWSVDLQDSLAYIGSYDGLTIVSVAQPGSPYVLSTTGGRRLMTCGVAVRDTFAFIPTLYDTFWVYSVADPAAPYPIASMPLGSGNSGYDATMINDTLVFVGCEFCAVLVNVRNPAIPIVVGSHAIPAPIRRAVFAEPYVYACCGGIVLIFELRETGVSESVPVEVGLPTRTTVVRGELRLSSAEMSGEGRASLLDACGREVMMLRAGANDVRGLVPGVYFIAREGRWGKGPEEQRQKVMILH